jgi:hypothetical protein
MEASCREGDCAAVRLRTCGAGWGSPATPRKELELQGACARVSFEQVGAAHVAVRVRRSRCRIISMIRVSSTWRSTAAVPNSARKLQSPNS